MTLAVRHRWGATGFALPPADTFQLAPQPTGGFNPWSVPNAIYHGGKSYIGVVRGSDGDIRVLSFDHASGVTSGYLVHDNWQADEHSPPAITRRVSDGKLMVVYTQHNWFPMNMRTSTNPDDASSWSAATSLGAGLGGTHMTYPQVHQLSAETNTFFLLFRDEPTAGTDSRWCISNSTTDGATYPTKTILYRVAGHRSYLTSWTDGVSRIHFLATDNFDTVGGIGGTSSLGHFYYEGGAYYKTNGTAIGHGPPFAFSDLTPIWSVGDPMLPDTLHLDGSGYPVASAHTVDPATGIYSYWYLRWTGSAWRVTEVVANAGTGHIYTLPSTTTVYGVCLDDGNVNVLYSVEPVLGKPEVYKYTTADDGLTFSRRYVTRFSAYALQGRPLPIRGRGSADELKCYWYFGTMTSYTSYNLGTMGTST